MNRKAFTIFEMGIMITCITILIFIITQSSVLIKSINVMLTKSKLDKINTALKNHINTYGYLPCPSDITVLYNDKSNFGKEVRSVSNGDCITNSGIFQYKGLFVGGVPIKKLGLQDEDGIDYWDNKIIYVVDDKLVKKYKNIETNLCVAFYGTNTYSKIDNVYYALISNGSNEVGAIPKNRSNNKNMSVINEHEKESSNIFSITNFLFNDSGCLNAVESNNMDFDDIMIFNIYDKHFDF